MSTTGGRVRTCRHSSSFPAVVHRPLCSRCADARAIAAASHSYFLSLFTFGAVNAARRRFSGACALTLSHHRGQTIDDAAVRVPDSPKSSAAGFAFDRHRRCATAFAMTTGAGCAGPSIRFGTSRVAHVRATETEWHRNRSVATSRGAWLPALICMGGFSSASGKERHDRRSC